MTDPTGLAARSSVEIVSEANHYRQALVTDDAGNVEIKRLPFGTYLLKIHRVGLAPFSESVEVRSAAPTIKLVRLSLSPIETTIVVKSSDTLIDPQSVGSVNQIGSAIGACHLALPVAYCARRFRQAWGPATQMGWSAYNGDVDGDHYSSLSQITPANNPL